MTPQPQNTPSAPAPLKTRASVPGERPVRWRGWLITLSILGIILAGGAAYYLLRPLDAPIPEGAGAQYTGLEQGVTAQGFPRLGSPGAPVLVEDFSSFACPHCREFHEGQFVGLLDAIAAGEVQFVLVPVPHIGWGAGEAGKAALCAGEQGQAWTMVDVLYDWQRRFVTSTFDSRRVHKGAEALGLDMAAFDSCMRGSAVQDVLDRARAEFDRRGLTGTPSFFINGQKVQDYRELEALGTSYDSAEAPSS
ncbi:MAG: thioredoxin domain-containing protein [Anaerolineae bacterium]|nr:thioredoxin domain-containing protein [Anaerolineae bacterium]